MALRAAQPEPADGPPTAAAEMVPRPSPDASPSPGATLEPLPSPSVLPVEPPEPTVEPTPSPLPSPSPSPLPPLQVGIDTPGDGASLAATATDGEGRDAADVTVSAAVTGTGDGGAEVQWTSDRAPDRVLLTGASGQVLLWLSDPCTDTPHTLTATATDAAGRTATDSVQVTATESCPEQVAVDITAPADGATFAAQTDGSGRYVDIPVNADVTDPDVAWRWTSDLQPGTTLTGPGGGAVGQSGTVRIRLDDGNCPPGSTVTTTLGVQVERASDGATAADDAQPQVSCDP